jgi:hypothetical protein
MVATPALAADGPLVPWQSPDTTKAPPLPDYMRSEITEGAAWMDAHEVKGPNNPMQQGAPPTYQASAPASSNLPIFEQPPARYWTGFYVGGQIGAARGTANFADPFGASISGIK